MDERLTAHAKISIMQNDMRNMEKQIAAHLEATDSKVDNHQDILINNGKGLVFRVGRIESLKDHSRITFSAVMSVLAALIALASVIMQIMK